MPSTLLTQRRIFIFWLPLVASWILMAADGPMISAAVNRLPDPVVTLAACGIVIALSVFIESPIINLLATSTALAKDFQSYQQLKRFTLHWCYLLTGVTAAIAFTPLFDLVVGRWMGVPPEVQLLVRPGMQVMTLWSAAIAWRRFLQGVLITFGYGRRMAEGTFIRMLLVVVIILATITFTDLSGIYVATFAWMGGVVGEAIFATWAIRPLLANELHPDQGHKADQPLGYLDLLKFHLPLAGTSVLVLFIQPLVAASLNRLDQPTLSLAAWPVVFQLMLLLRAPALSFPEAVIALSKSQGDVAPIQRFSLYATGLTFLGTALIVFSPLASGYIFGVQGMEGASGALALSTLPYFLIFPALWFLSSWLRGVLISQKQTQAINIGMAVNLTITAVLLTGGTWLRLPGLPLAAVSLSLAIFVETFYLGWRASRLVDLSLGWRLKPVRDGGV